MFLALKILVFFQTDLRKTSQVENKLERKRDLKERMNIDKRLNCKIF